MHVAQDVVPWMEATPQPVALATGRVVRAVGSAEKLDACIKAAEVVARFVALASLASSAATRPVDVSPPEVANFAGNLSFGMFEKAIHASAAVPWDHPLRGQLRRCFRRRHAISGQRLAEFVRLRNELGHAITPADEARARVLMERDDPIGGLLVLLEDLKDIFAYPLLALLGQEHRRGRFLGRFIFFSGEGEPIPQEIELKDPVYEWERPYLCTEAGLLPLAPGLLYRPRSSDGRFGLYLLDKISNEKLSYKSIQDNGELEISDQIGTMNAWINLPLAPVGRQLSYPLLESIACPDGRSLYAHLSGHTQTSEGTEGVADASFGERGAQAQPRERAANSLREFERRVNRLALGGTYRDILYSFSGNDSLAEVRDGTVRITRSADPSRVIGTIEIATTRKLRLTMFISALTSDRNQEVEVYELAAGDSADGVVERLNSLMRGS